MRRRIAITVSAAAFGAAGAALAQAEPPFAAKTYSTAENCASQDVMDEGGTLLLGAAGIEGNEFRCEFVDLRPAFEGRSWLAQAACEEPGLQYANILLIAPREDDGSGLPKTLAVTETSARDLVTVYHRCD